MAQELLLLIQPHCELCEDAMLVLLQLGLHAGRDYRVAELASEPQLERFLYKVPVLLCGSEELQCGRFDADDLAQRISAI